MRLFLPVLMVALLIGLVGSAQASATEPVFDSAYDTQLGNILRTTMSTSHADYLALELEAKRGRAGDVTARRIMGQLGRLRAEIGSAPPLRFLGLVGNSSGPASIGQYFDRASDAKWTLYSADWVPQTGFYTWMYEGRSAPQTLCANSSGYDPAVPYHRLRAVSGPCEVEDATNWNDNGASTELRGTIARSPGNHESYGGCTHTPTPYVFLPAPCMATWIATSDFWEMIEVGNTQPLGSQNVDQAVPYSQWPYASAPQAQNDALADGRDLLGEDEYRILRQWLNHRLDPENYPAPVNVLQTLGASCDSNLAPTECEQARR